MSATHFERIERLQHLLDWIPPPRTARERCPDVARLEELLADDYGRDSSPSARRRRLQRDLAELARDKRIAPVNPGGKPLRYRRLEEAGDDDPKVIAYTRQLINEAVADLLPKGRLDALWRKLLVSKQVPELDEQRLRILPADYRLTPAAVCPSILGTVISAVAERRVLAVKHRKSSGETSHPKLHPQALVQRGPVTYLAALKNDEPAHVQFYALHRLISARLTEQAGRVAEDFDLDKAIEDGLIDFGPGEHITLELRVRGYLSDLLESCPLAKGQEIVPEPEGAAFDQRLRARVPSSGALLRWLLAGGDNLEVVAPEALRATLAAQTAKAAALYADTTETPAPNAVSHESTRVNP